MHAGLVLQMDEKHENYKRVAEVVDGFLVASVDVPVSPADWAPAAVQVDEDPAELATTGVSSGVLALIAMVAIVGGGLLLGAQRRLA